MKMARMLIDTMSVDEFEPEKFTNNYHDQLMTMIEARAAGKELPKPKKAPARPKVVNLMDVLAQSLEESKKRRGAGAEKPARRAPQEDGRVAPGSLPSSDVRGVDVAGQLQGRSSVRARLIVRRARCAGRSRARSRRA